MVVSESFDRPLVVAYRALGLGDFLTGVPALRALARAFPDHHRVLAAPAALAPLAALTGAVDEVVDTAPLGPAPTGADVAVNLHGRGPESHAVLRASRPGRLIAFGEDGVPWRAGEHEVRRWCRLLEASGIPADPSDLDLARPLVPAPVPTATTIVHPGAASPARRWPPERWAAVARSELAAGRDVTITGSAAERELAEAIARAATDHPAAAAKRDSPGPPARAAVAARASDEGRIFILAGETDLLGLAATVASAGRVLCGDTGVAHLATAFGTPSVVLFGPTPPAEWGPPPERRPHVVLWAGQAGDPHGQTPDAGLLTITVDDVLRALQDDLADTRQEPAGLEHRG
jgi:ADP-heptose:LPS heptosyltransferase